MQRYERASSFFHAYRASKSGVRASIESSPRSSTPHAPAIWPTTCVHDIVTVFNLRDSLMYSIPETNGHALNTALSTPTHRLRALPPCHSAAIQQPWAPGRLPCILSILQLIRVWLQTCGHRTSKHRTPACRASSRCSRPTRCPFFLAPAMHRNGRRPAWRQQTPTGEPDGTGTSTYWLRIAATSARIAVDILRSTVDSTLINGNRGACVG